MQRKLFGDAFQLDLSDNYIDVSQLRQVPDNQEVFVSKNSDESFIVELLETPDYDKNLSIEYHWQDLCEANNALECKILQSKAVLITNLESEHNEEILVGIQSVPKFGKEADIDQVTIYMYMLRLSDLNTDILITWNVPGNHSDALDKFLQILVSFKILDLSVFNVQ